MPPDRMAIARAICEEAVAAEPSLVAVVVGGSAARGDCQPSSDVDVRILLDGQPAGAYGMRRREGILVDVECEPASKYARATDLLGDPYAAGFVREAVILFERDGAFGHVQREVIDRFRDPELLHARLATLLDPIERNGREFATAHAEGRWAAACRHFIFAVWTACDALLAREGVSPSRERNLQKLARALPDERDRVVDVEGTPSTGSDDVAACRALVADALGESPGVVMENALSAADHLAQAGLRPEAVHSLWITFGLSLGGMAAADPVRADQLARDWLDHVGRTRDEATGAGRLADYVAHVLTLIRPPAG